jgi:predicted methyltransferase
VPVCKLTVSVAVGRGRQPLSARPDVLVAEPRHRTREPAFAGVRPGDKAVDHAAGGGDVTRLFASLVGPGGYVYAFVPSSLFVYPNILKGIGEIQT